jgi:dTDP-4-amino-4,6-dideoxygalactose transaminase
MAQGFISNTWNIQLADASSRTKIVEACVTQGIETRTWWPAGLHEMAAFSSFEHDDMTATERLAAETLGLPCGTHLSEENFSKIAEVLASEVRE